MCFNGQTQTLQVEPSETSLFLSVCLRVSSLATLHAAICVCVCVCVCVRACVCVGVFMCRAPSMATQRGTGDPGLWSEPLKETQQHSYTNDTHTHTHTLSLSLSLPLSLPDRKSCVSR